MDGVGLQAMQELLQASQRMRTDLAAAKDDLAAMTIEGVAADGLVVAVFNGAGEIQRMRIAPEALASGDGEWLSDQIVAAIRDAAGSVREAQDNQIGPLLARMYLDQDR